MPKDWIFFALPRWLGLEIGGNNLIHHRSAQKIFPTCLGANHGIWAGWDHRPEPEWPKCFRQGSVSEGHVTRLPNNINNLLPQFHQQSSFIADCDSYSARQCRSFWGGLKLPYPLAAFHWRRAVAQCRQHNCPRIRLTLAVSSTKTPYWSLDPTVPHVRNVSDIPNPLRGGPHAASYPLTAWLERPGSCYKVYWRKIRWALSAQLQPLCVGKDASAKAAWPQAKHLP